MAWHSRTADDNCLEGLYLWGREQGQRFASFFFRRSQMELRTQIIIIDQLAFNAAPGLMLLLY